MKYDLKQIIDRLNPTVRGGLENAAALCVAQTNYNIAIEHLLIKLLEVADTDLARILRYYEVDPSEVNRELTATMDKFERGNGRTPAFSLHLMEWFQEGWIMSSLVFGEPQVRSGALMDVIHAVL